MKEIADQVAVAAFVVLGWTLAAAAAFSAVGVLVRRMLLAVPAVGASIDAIVTPDSPYEVGC